MITLLISALCFIGLIVLHFAVTNNNKTKMMAGILLIMLLTTIIDQVFIPKAQKPKQTPPSNPEPPLQKLNLTTQLYKSTPARSLLKQQRILLQYLLDKQSAKQNIITYISNIDKSRFRAIFREFQMQTHAPALLLDFGGRGIGQSEIEAVLGEARGGRGGRGKDQDRIVYFVVEGVDSVVGVNMLENIFLTYNVSYILDGMPRNLMELSALGKWTYHYQFQGNYIGQVLQNHPPRLVQLCNKYRTMDYSFYIMSQSQPLSQLCTKLPSNQITECIRKYLQKIQDRVPYSKVRKCFQGKQIDKVDGIIYQNGMIGLKKDYFYAGDMDKIDFRGFYEGRESGESGDGIGDGAGL